MRIRQLNLIRYGHFRDMTIDFGRDEGRTHVIFGSNEAGKSTILRSISGLLFGIPETTRDDHLHRKSDLRIGATIGSSRGDLLTFVRRKGRKQTLLDGDGKALDDGVITSWLGGVGRELFDTLFGLSHERLLRGGEDLLAGRGEMGESLFSAGAGILGFHAVRTGLWKEANEIFTPRSHTLPLNQAIRDHQEAKRKVVHVSLRPASWQELRERLTQAETELTRLDAAFNDASAELARLSRIRRVLPPLNVRRQLLETLHALGDVRVLPESASGERKDAQASLERTDVAEKKLISELIRLREEMADLDVPETLLSLEPEITSLRDHLGAHRKAMADLPAIRARADAAETEIRNILSDLGRRIPIDDVDRLRVDAPTEAVIRKLARERGALDTDLKKAVQDLEDSEQQLRELQKRIDGLPPRQDAGDLRRIVQEARRHGDIEKSLRDLDRELLSLADKVTARMSALILWQGTADALEGLAVPSAETLERFRKRFLEYERDGILAGKRKAEIQQRLRETTSKLAELDARGTVPSEAGLQDLRGRREEAWNEVRRALINRHEPDPSAREAVVRRYEGLLRDADALVDRLWREADRAAIFRALSAERLQREAEAGEADRLIQRLSNDLEALSSEWRSLWEPLGIAPLQPDEMKGWLDNREKTVELIGQWKSRRREQESLQRLIGELKDACSDGLTALDEQRCGSGESLLALLARADEVIGKVEVADRERQQAFKEKEKLETSRAKLQRNVARSGENLGRWTERWSTVVTALGLRPDSSTDEAEAMLSGISRLFGKLSEFRSDRARIDHIAEDAARFAAAVTDLAKRCGIDAADVPAERSAQEIIVRFDKGKENRTAREAHEKRIKDIEHECAGLRLDRQAAQGILDRLLREGGCAHIGELTEAVRKSDEYREIRKSLRTVEDQLLREDVPLEDLEQQASTVDADTIGPAITRAEEGLVAVRKQRDGLQERIGGIRKELDAMDGGRVAADAAAEAEEALSKIGADVERYVRIKLAALLLDTEIERYRQKNQGPLLVRAGEMFSRITTGAYAGLTSGFTSGDEVVLMCLRDDGAEVPVEGLSDGTRDQLYLALRLASLERHVERNEPLPLILDDVLINFDDDRAAATMGLLGDLSVKTQLLFFTHHRRMVEIARAAVPADRLMEHDLV